MLPIALLYYLEFFHLSPSCGDTNFGLSFSLLSKNGAANSSMSYIELSDDNILRLVKGFFMMCI